MSKRVKMLTLVTSVMVFTSLVVTSAVMGNGGRGPDRQIEGELYLPVLSSRHDPTLNAPVFGTQMYGNTGPTSVYYDFLVESGSSWVRVPVNWANIEPVDVDPQSYNWTSSDRALSAASVVTRSLSVIATIGSNPSWAATYSQGPIDPEDLDSFAEFVQAIVERYDGDGMDDAPGSPVVNHWELYNEPDESVKPHWGNAGAEYADMLSTVYPAVKSANPYAQVLFGGIAYDWFDNQGGHFNRQFLDDVLAAGGGDYFDLMNFHVYPVFWYNWTTRESPGLLEKANVIKGILADSGYPNKPIIVTEAGWHSNDHPQFPSTLEDQARYVVELFTQNMAAESQLMIWWMLYDPGGGYQFDNGLVTNGTPPVVKPAYLAFQVAVAELASTHFQRVLPLSETGAPEMEAYQFKDNVHRQTVYVAWLDPVDSSNVKQLRIPASLALVSDIYGNEVTILDGQDGQIDGFVTVDIGGQPSYIKVGW